MNNTIGLGYVVTPVPTSPILFFFQTSPHNANDLEILQNFGINYWHSASQHLTLYRITQFYI